MSLKGVTYRGSNWTNKFLDTIEDFRDGKANSEKKLYKYVESGEITSAEYEELIKKYGAIHRINKEKNDRKRTERIRDAFYGSVASLILLGSMATTLGEIVVRHGKGIAVPYLFLWLWAFSYIKNNNN